MLKKPRFNLTSAFAVFLTISLLWPAMVLAWGGWEHEVVGHIALLNLSPHARVKLRAILGDQTDVGDICIWADRIRKNRRVTGPWHYINYPLSASRPDYDIYQRPAKNIVSAMQEQLEVLKNPRANRIKRREALKFIVHFSGDIHQPLHCATGVDLGGNTIKLRFEGKETNFHAIWDYSLTPNREDDPRQAAYRLWGKTSPQQREILSRGTPEEWMIESHILARDFSYPLLSQLREENKGRQRPDLSGIYSEKAAPIVEQQLLKAGLRLSALLEDALIPVGIENRE